MTDKLKDVLIQLPFLKHIEPHLQSDQEAVVICGFVFFEFFEKA